MKWNSPAIRRLVQEAMVEDAASQDITTQALIPPGLKIEAQIIAKVRGVVCGLPLAGAFFKRLDRNATFTARVREGQAVKPGQVLALIRGKARAILSAERPALNALQHLSGVATLTREQIRHLRSKRTEIYDTRKTLPGWRVLQKYAVACGGGKNHRMSLRDSILIKDNHLQICRLAKIDWLAAIRRWRRNHSAVPVELEIQTSRDLRDALELAPRQILLDNLPPARLRSLIKQLRSRIRGVEIEISGSVRTDQVASLSRLNVERISMGRLTHSAPALDCALDITHVFNPR